MNFDFVMELADDEEVKPLLGAPRGYFITNKARIFAQGPGLGKKGRWLRPNKSTSREYYHDVTIKKRSYRLHRLVGQHFLSGFSPDLNVCHRDETLPYPQVHYAENLFLGTHKDNMIDMTAKGRNVGYKKSIEVCPCCGKPYG